MLYRSIATNNRILLRDSHMIIIRPVLLVTDLMHMLVQQKNRQDEPHKDIASNPQWFQCCFKRLLDEALPSLVQSRSCLEQHYRHAKQSCVLHFSLLPGRVLLK